MIRLIDPEIGFISPDEFIPIAEKNGSILKIGEIVFNKVFKFIRDTDIADLGLEYIDINLSVVQCMQEDLAEKVLSLIDKYNIKKEQINLEITETALAASPKILLKNMKELTDKGISFSLDDFGTGYSNISSLTELPLHIIKFDRTLVNMASDKKKGRMVINSSAAMVKQMGMEIVAEGVEDKEQLDMIIEMGINYIQGYYFSKPLPQEKFIEYCHTVTFSPDSK